MNLETFTEAIQLMCDALPAQQQQKRISALYQIFGEKEYFDLKNASESVAKELDYFPTPNVFAQFLARAKKTQNNVDVGGRCNYCDGYGWAMIDGLAHRGACSHGETLSKIVKRAPEGWVNQKPVYKKGERA